MNQRGKLYLIPVTLGNTNSNEPQHQSDPLDVLPLKVKNTLAIIDHYIVENEKDARRFIKSILPEKVQATLHLSCLNKHTEPSAHRLMLQPCIEGFAMGLMSDAGCPGVADPGAAIVKLAHETGIQVVPLVGPSSILLAMMASGMNGQSFAFNGYLPIDKSEKKTAIKNFEKRSYEQDQSQLFIETPYRNNKLLEDFLQVLHPNTLLCIACDLTLPTEFIKTQRVADWKKSRYDLDKRPALFILHKMN